MADALLDNAEVARRLSLAPATVRKLLCERAMPVVKLGRRTLVRPEDLEAYILQHVEEAAGTRRQGPSPAARTTVRKRAR